MFHDWPSKKYYVKNDPFTCNEAEIQVSLNKQAFIEFLLDLGNCTRYWLYHGE